MDLFKTAGRMEAVAQELFVQLQTAFIKDLADEDFVTDLLISIAADPAKYSEILDPRVTRLALAYNSAMNSYMEPDELAYLESLAKPEVEADESETAPSDQENRGEVLDFPTDIFNIPEEDDDE